MPLQARSAAYDRVPRACGIAVATSGRAPVSVSSRRCNDKQSMFCSGPVVVEHTKAIGIAGQAMLGVWHEKSWEQAVLSALPLPAPDGIPRWGLRPASLDLQTRPTMYTSIYLSERGEAGRNDQTHLPYFNFSPGGWGLRWPKRQVQRHNSLNNLTHTGHLQLQLWLGAKNSLQDRIKRM